MHPPLAVSTAGEGGRGAQVAGETRVPSAPGWAEKGHWAGFTPAALLCLHLHRLFQGSTLQVLFHINIDKNCKELFSQRKISLESISKSNKPLLKAQQL